MLNFCILCFCILFVHSSIAQPCNELRTALTTRKVAGHDQFPYYVAIHKKRVFACGGTVIGPHKVLTSGHCLVKPNGRPVWRRRLQIWGRGNKLKHLYARLDVSRVVLHPHFHRGYPMANDLGMLITHRNFYLSAIPPIPLQKASVPENTECAVLGWGKDNQNQESLMFGAVTIADHEKCVQGSKVPKNLNTVCIGYSELLQTVSPYGGALLKCNELVTGILSFGPKPLTSSSYVVFTNISNYLGWINSGPNLISLDFRLYILCLIVIYKNLLL